MMLALIAAEGPWGWAAVLLVGLGSVGLADVEQKGPEGVLAEKGLTREGIRYVLDEEAEALKELPRAQQAVAAADAARRKAEAVGVGAGTLPDLQARRSELAARVRSMNITISQMPVKGRRNSAQNRFVLDRNQVASQLTALELQIANARRNQPTPGQQTMALSEAERLRGAAATRVEELDATLAAIEESYAALIADETVKEAVVELNRANRTVLKIAPSDEFVRARQWAARVKTMIGPATAEEDEETTEGRPRRRGARAEEEAEPEPGAETGPGAETEPEPDAAAGPDAEAKPGRAGALQQLRKAAALLERVNFARNNPQYQERDSARLRTLGLINEAIETLRRREDATDVVAKAIEVHTSYGPGSMTANHRRILDQARDRLNEVQALLKPAGPETP